MWTVREVGCSEYGMFEMWDVRYVRYSGCEMWDICWDVGC